MHMVSGQRREESACFGFTCTVLRSKCNSALLNVYEFSIIMHTAIYLYTILNNTGLRNCPKSRTTTSNTNSKRKHSSLTNSYATILLVLYMMIVYIQQIERHYWPSSQQYCCRSWSTSSSVAMDQACTGQLSMHSTPCLLVSSGSPFHGESLTA